MTGSRAQGSGFSGYQGHLQAQQEAGETEQSHERARRKGKRVLQGEGSVAPGIHDQSVAEEHVLHHLPSTAPERSIPYSFWPRSSAPQDDSILQALKEYRLQYFRNRDRYRRGYLGLPARLEQAKLLELRNRWVQENVSLPEPVTEETFREQREQAADLVEFARFVCQLDRDVLTNTQKKKFQSIIAQRDKALEKVMRKNRDCEAKECKNRRVSSLLPSTDEEEWLKENIGEIKTLSMENELNEAETRWEKLFALLKIAMEAYEFNQPAITPDTRGKLRLMFYNIVARKKHEVQQEEFRRAL